MKLTKISLAALVALGAFSSVASATPLEEAIKNVDMSGFVRYRYDYGSTKIGSDKNHMGSEGVKTNHKFKAKINFKAMLDDNFAGVIGIRYNSDDNTANRADTVEADKHFGVYQIYLDYTVGNTLIRVGKQELSAAFFVDDEVGTGILALNSDIQGLTLGAFAIDALDVKTEADGALLEAVEGGYKPGNLYGVAALGSYDPVAFQLWYASLEKVVDLFAVQLSGDVKVSDDVKFGLQGQFVNSSADSAIKKALANNGGYDDGKFYSVEANTGLFGADFALGYVGWKAKNGASTSFALEDQGKLVSPGEQFSDYFDYTFLKDKGAFYYVNAGYAFDKFSVGADYVNGKVKDTNNDKDKYKEYVARLGYDYSKKLKFSTFYSAAELKNGDKKEKSNLYRFQAKYSF